MRYGSKHLMKEIGNRREITTTMIARAEAAEIQEYSKYACQAGLGGYLQGSALGAFEYQRMLMNEQPRQEMYGMYGMYGAFGASGLGGQVFGVHFGSAATTPTSCPCCGRRLR